MRADFHDNTPAHPETVSRLDAGASVVQGAQRLHDQDEGTDLQHGFDPVEFTPRERLMWLSQAAQFVAICRGIARGR
jgi:hypothetical protein